MQPWFSRLPNQTDLIQVISSLVETPRTEMGLSDKRSAFRDIWKNVLIQQISFPIDYQWGMRSVGLKHSSKYLPLCSAEQINT